MKRNKHLIFILLLATILLDCSRKEDTPNPGLNYADLDSLFTHFTPEYNYTTEPTEMLAHASVVSVQGYATWSGFHGTKDSLGSAPVDSNTIFRIGSTTKMFTATIILQLMEEGLINLNTPFNNYLGLDPATYPQIEKFSSVTIEHLLSHRSGIPMISSTSFYEVYEYTDSIAQTVRMKFLFTEGEPEFLPGTQYAYRNSNFNILGLVIEKVTGASYSEVLKQRIFDPLGLINTYLLDFGISGKDQRMAHGYCQSFDGTLFHGSQAWAGGGLVSTARDLSLFMDALIHGNLFQWPGTLDLMITPKDGSPYGFGIFITQTPQGLAYGHGGAIFGYNTRLEYFPALEATIVSTMSFNGYDFMVINWYDDICYQVVKEIRKAKNPT